MWRTEACSKQPQRETHRLRSGVVVFERDIAKAARAAPIIGDKGISDLTVGLEGAPQQLREESRVCRRRHACEQLASGAAGDKQDRRTGHVMSGFSGSSLPWGRRLTLPLTLHGKFEQKSCVLENGRSVSGAGVFSAIDTVPLRRSGLLLAR